MMNLQNKNVISISLPDVKYPITIFKVNEISGVLYLLK